jgi:branched-chain amino acid transport system substrate-binding protein
MSRKINRRSFLKLTGGGLAGAALLGAAAGCGGEGGQGGGSGPIKIGGLLSFTGPFAPLAESIRNGLDLFFEQNNNQIGDRQVEVSYADDEGDPQVALRKYRQLVSRDQVDFVVGPISSSVALALVDQVERDQVILIDANAAANALSWEKKNDYVYRVSFSNWQNGTAGASYIAENVGTTAYALAPDYPAGTEVLAAFRAAFEAAGGEVVQETYPPLGNNDYATYLTEIQQAEPELVFAFFAGSDAIRFVEQYQSFGLKDRIPLTGTAEFGDELLTEPTGAAAEGIISAVHYSPFRENEANRRFVEAYQSAYDGLPNMFSCQGYDSGQVIAAAVEEAGGTETGALIEALSEVSVESPRGPITLDPETHNPIQNYYVVRNVVEGDRIILEDLETVEELTMPAEPPA